MSTSLDIGNWALGIGHWALGTCTDRTRTASRRQAVDAAFGREVLVISPLSYPCLMPHALFPILFSQFLRSLCGSFYCFN
ncbi:MAG: hypothetical protein V7K98_09005 [Nostoc sp.]|uniref:hypothetical protein n=1 Tax=Nostoc sp. TaxID=1180 RepID=UPI002FF75805